MTTTPKHIAEISLTLTIKDVLCQSGKGVVAIDADISKGTVS